MAYFVSSIGDEMHVCKTTDPFHSLLKNGSSGVQESDSQAKVPYEQTSEARHHTGWTPPPEAPIGPRQQGPDGEDYWSTHESTSGANAPKKQERSESDLEQNDKDVCLMLIVLIISIKEEEYAS